MSRKKRQELAMRAVFVGCQFCGATDRTLRNHGGGKICPVCLARKPWETMRGVQIGHQKGASHD